MKILSPAKINLSLRVKGRRPDGYHEIETLMVPLSLADEIDIQESGAPGMELTCDDPAVPPGGENLAMRAAEEFGKAVGRDPHLRIQLTKRIPMGAGLGGGSSNAAAVILALNRLWNTGLTAHQLEVIASRTGSDTAFFVQRTPAICRGRGEIIEPFELRREYPLVLVKPPFGVETPWAYRAFAAAPPAGPLPAEQTLDDLQVVNDLEHAVFEKFLILPLIRSWFLAQPGVRVSAMSGSGSTVFAVVDHPDRCVSLIDSFTARFGRGYWTAACSTLPTEDFQRGPTI